MKEGWVRMFTGFNMLQRAVLATMAAAVLVASSVAATLIIVGTTGG